APKQRGSPSNPISTDQIPASGAQSTPTGPSLSTYHGASPRASRAAHGWNTSRSVWPRRSTTAPGIAGATPPDGPTQNRRTRTTRQTRPPAGNVPAVRTVSHSNVSRWPNEAERRSSGSPGASAASGHTVGERGSSGRDAEAVAAAGTAAPHSSAATAR